MAILNSVVEHSDVEANPDMEEINSDLIVVATGRNPDTGKDSNDTGNAAPQRQSFPTNKGSNDVTL